jgi:hypothetical protein
MIMPNHETTRITPAMERAGITRLADLLEAGTSLAYVASEVFEAMESARAKEANPSSLQVPDHGRCDK